MLGKIKKNMFISIGIAGIVYLAFIMYADYNQLVLVLKKITVSFVLIILSLSLLNYLARFAKWHFYLKELKVKISVIDSFTVFMSGLIMSVTPGKMGELMKAYLVKEITATPVSRTAPIIFAERITDFLSLVLIAVIGAYQFNYGKTITISVGVFFVALTIVLSSKQIMEYIFLKLQRIAIFRKHFEKIMNAYESSYSLLQLRPLLLMSALSIVAWFFECLGYYLILRNFEVHVSLLWAAFAYAFGTIVGAITMLPGGLGVTEGSLTFLVVQLQYPKEAAIASTFLIRIATLWFAVFLGIISVFWYQKRFGLITIDSLEKNPEQYEKV
ncbi:MAG: flippase-like domain-containing protein [Ignavibacteriales bacterium]|nr:flippase-like domain-containing protein [Ignavibacteriales bacterium]